MSLSLTRHAGLLLPLFSMPSSRSWGIGEIGDVPLVTAWLADAHQDLLQLLPINEMAVGQRSPYSAMTAMAIDPIYISAHAMEDFAAIGGEAAMDAGWKTRLAAARASATIDYGLARGLKNEALRAAFARFRADEWSRSSPRAAAFAEWAAGQAWWLDDYSLYRAIHQHEGERSWTEWPDALRRREPRALDEARHDLGDEVVYRRWLQWIADEQWRAARAQSKPVALLGDLPFMVDGDSADVWANASDFRFDATVGAPPDAFSQSGQNWGLPAYRWEVMARDGFRWLRQRARRSAALYDGYRVDHLVGFYRTYLFPRDGSASFFTPASEADQLALGETVLRLFAEPGARIIAEDLGTVPDFVRASLARLEVPGFKVLRWEREWHQEHQPYRAPESYSPLSVATTGTHDTDTLAAWWDGLDDAERGAVMAVPGLSRRLTGSAPGGGHRRFNPRLRDALLGLLFASGSSYLLLPVQDVFGWRDRINTPASPDPSNWTWRVPWPVDELPRRPECRERAEALARWSDESGRWAARADSRPGTPRGR